MTSITLKEPISAPPRHVLAAFGLSGSVVRLAGGAGRTFRCGGAVLKPTEDPVAAAWNAEVLNELADLPEDGFHIPRPMAARSGGWVADGWTSFEYYHGEHPRTARWPDILAVSVAFHRALAQLQLPRPDFLDQSTDWWSVGDRVAWSEAEVTPPAPLGPLLSELQDQLRRVDDLPSQVIHGDLGGNVLFAPGSAPAVIDFAAYFRPAGFAAAIVVVDALVWEGADPGLLELVADWPHMGQLLFRAMIYRIVTTGEASPQDAERLEREVRANRPVLDLLRNRFGE